MTICKLIVTVFCAGLLTEPASSSEHDYFRINVVDSKTGRGVPLVELKTVNDIRYYTDSAGTVAFHEPGLMNQAVFFFVQSHGYEYPEDGFGYRGAQVKTTPGGVITLKIKRLNIAERLYRVTGQGIYRDSVLVGAPAPIERTVLNGRVFGSDSIFNAVYHGKICWFWGDTTRPSYPLGNFHVSGAVSRLPGDGGLDPEVGISFHYFVGEDGFARPMAKMPGEGPTWIDGLVVLNENGRERLFGSYVKVEPPLRIYRRGLAEFNDQAMQFENFRQFDMQSPLFPSGHTFTHDDGGTQYVYFGNPFPLIRVRATVADVCDLSAYQAYTCFAKGSRTERSDLVRDADKLSYQWKTDTLPYTPELEMKLIENGRIEPGEGLFRLADEHNSPILIHSGSVRWNEYRERWIMIGLQSHGTSPLGEIWYAEARQLVGPWQKARKIVTHDKYSFYNPKHHVVFDKHDGRVIFFEGTYTNMFSGNDDPTPRYNYNQLMYRLDLSDARLR